MRLDTSLSCAGLPAVHGLVGNGTPAPSPAIATPVVSTTDSLAGDTRPTYAIDFVEPAPDGGGIGDTLEGRWGTSLAAMAAMTPESVMIDAGIFIDGDDPFPDLGAFSAAQTLGTTIYFSFRVVRGADESDWSNTGTLLLVDGTMDAPGLSDLIDQATSTRVWSASFSVSGLAAGAYARLEGTGPIRVDGATIHEAGEQVLVQNGASVEFGVDTSETAGTAVGNVVSNRGVALETFSATTAASGVVWTPELSPPAALSIGFASNNADFASQGFAAGAHVIFVSSSARQIAMVTVDPGGGAWAATQLTESGTANRNCSIWLVTVATPGTYTLRVTGTDTLAKVGISKGELAGHNATPTDTQVLDYGYRADPQQTPALTVPVDGIGLGCLTSESNTAATWNAGTKETDLGTTILRHTSGRLTASGTPTISGFHNAGSGWPSSRSVLQFRRL